MPSTQPSDGGKVQYDPELTDRVMAATRPEAEGRLREVMAVLVRHVHDFAREVNLTTDGFMAGIELLNWASKMSTDRR